MSNPEIASLTLLLLGASTIAAGSVLVGALQGWWSSPVAEAQKQLAKAHPQLKRHFKVEAVFDDSVERSDETVAAYARMIAGIIAQNDLKPVEAGGVARLIDEAARRARGRKTLDTV